MWWPKLLEGPMDLSVREGKLTCTLSYSDHKDLSLVLIGIFRRERDYIGFVCGELSGPGHMENY